MRHGVMVGDARVLNSADANAVWRMLEQAEQHGAAIAAGIIALGEWGQRVAARQEADRVRAENAHPALCGCDDCRLWR